MLRISARGRAGATAATAATTTDAPRGLSPSAAPLRGQLETTSASTAPGFLGLDLEGGSKAGRMRGRGGGNSPLAACLCVGSRQNVAAEYGGIDCSR